MQSASLARRRTPIKTVHSGTSLAGDTLCMVFGDSFFRSLATSFRTQQFHPVFAALAGSPNGCIREAAAAVFVSSASGLKFDHRIGVLRGPAPQLLAARKMLDAVFGGKLVEALLDASRANTCRFDVVLFELRTSSNTLVQGLIKDAFQTALTSDPVRLDVATMLIAVCTGVINAVDGRGKAALHNAAARGKVHIVNFLLSKPITNVNQCDGHGRTALVAACAEDASVGSCTLPCIRLLLAAPGCAINTQTSGGSTALAFCACHGSAHHVRVASLLLTTHGIAINAADLAGQTALMHAAKRSHSVMVTLLVNAPAINVNRVDRTGKTALMHACIMLGQPVNRDPSRNLQHRMDCVRALLTAPDMRSNIACDAGLTAIDYACAHKRWDAVEALLEHKTTAVANTAVHSGDLRAMRKHVHRMALEAVCGSGRVDLVAALLIRGACRHHVHPADHPAPVQAVFASGVDYWQRTCHQGHSTTLKAVVLTLLLVQQRLSSIDSSTCMYNQDTAGGATAAITTSTQNQTSAATAQKLLSSRTFYHTHTNISRRGHALTASTTSACVVQSLTPKRNRSNGVLRPRVGPAVPQFHFDPLPQSSSTFGFATGRTFIFGAGLAKVPHATPAPPTVASTPSSALSATATSFGVAAPRTLLTGLFAPLPTRSTFTFAAGLAKAPSAVLTPPTCTAPSASSSTPIQAPTATSFGVSIPASFGVAMHRPPLAITARATATAKASACVGGLGALRVGFQLLALDGMHRRAAGPRVMEGDMRMSHLPEEITLLACSFLRSADFPVAFDEAGSTPRKRLAAKHRTT